jgi:hypothetical protein
MAMAMAGPPAASGPVGAESGLPLPGAQPPGPVASPAAAVATPPRRRPRWLVQLEAFGETWLPPRARVLGAAAAVVGSLVGFGVVVAASSVLAREPGDARTLVIRSTPAGASVSIDDERAPGTTPLIIDRRLANGPHTLKLGLAAGPPAIRKLELTATDRHIAVRENLQSSGSVRVETWPPGAPIQLDQRHVGPAPVTIADVSLDKPHAIVVDARGYKRATASIPVERAGVHVVRLRLEPIGTPPRLVVQTSIPAELEIDGQDHGSTGAAELPAIAGPHVVVVRVPGLGIERRSTVDVPAQGVLKLFVPLD